MTENILSKIEESDCVWGLFDKQNNCSISFTKKDGLYIAVIGVTIDTDTANEMVIKLGKIFNWDFEFMSDLLSELKQKLGE
jgi:hypothetical protein